MGIMRMTENELKNDWKNVYCEHPGKENEAKMHFTCQEQCQKGEKWPFFGSLFAKAMVWFDFVKNDHYIAHFSFHSQFHFWEKWNQNEIKNEWKMNEKWTENANCEQP